MSDVYICIDDTGFDKIKIGDEIVIHSLEYIDCDFILMIRVIKGKHPMFAITGYDRIFEFDYDKFLDRFEMDYKIRENKINKLLDE